MRLNGTEVGVKTRIKKNIFSQNIVVQNRIRLNITERVIGNCNEIYVQ